MQALTRRVSHFSSLNRYRRWENPGNLNTRYNEAAVRCRGERVRFLALTVCVALQLALATPLPGADVSPGRQLYVEPSPLAALIDELPGMDPVVRIDLAAIIIDGLAAAYEAELDAAVEEQQRRGGGRRDLSRWYQGFGQIIDELRAWEAALYVAEEVELELDRHSQILLLIDGRPLWVAWPRLSARSRLERELATQFCLRHECPPDLLEGAAARAVAPSAAPGTWRLVQLQPPTWESADGINCEFGDYSRLGEKERSCRDLVADMHALAAALRAALRDGAHVEWSQVSLRPGTNGGQHRVTVNQHDDYIVVYLPVLATQQVDWREARRWLQARVDGGSTRATVLRAAP